MQLFSGILFHGIGASSAELCYTPEKKVRGWGWQSYWLAQVSVCWFFLPLVVAFLTVPSLTTILKEASASAMLHSFLLGMAYGVGGAAFGMAIKYIGFSPSYAISVGLSCVLGTLIPPIMDGSMTAVINGRGGTWIIAGVFLGAFGIAFCGNMKERNIQNEKQVNNGFSFKKGMQLCIVAGVLSAFYGFAITAGKPISDITAQHGAGNFQVNGVYIFYNSGAFITTLLYTLYLHTKKKTFGEFKAANNSVKAEKTERLTLNNSNAKKLDLDAPLIWLTNVQQCLIKNIGPFKGLDKAIEGNGANTREIILRENYIKDELILIGREVDTREIIK